MRARLLNGLVVSTVLVLLAACGSDSDDAADTTEATTTTTTTTSSGEETTTTAPAAVPEDGCGVTLADVQALLPPESGVTENSTPDPGRCNFTWDDGGPRGIDVARIPGGRSTFETGSDKRPDGPDQLVDGTPYELVEVGADEAWGFGDAGHVSVVALQGDDLYAVDFVVDGPPPGGGLTEAGLNTDLLAICSALLETMLD